MEWTLIAGIILIAAMMVCAMLYEVVKSLDNIEEKLKGGGK